METINTINTRPAKTEEEKKIILICYKAGMENGWASGKYARADGDFISEADRLNRNSICFCDSIESLKSFFMHGNWCLGQGIIYKNLFFLQQVDGGDEWATYRIKEDHAFAFESMTMGAIIKGGEFEKDIESMLNATDEQLKKLEY